MVAVGSPYSVLPKSFSEVFGDAAPYLTLGWCFARAAVRTGESSDDLKSWLLERLYLLIYRLGSSLRPPLALALRTPPHSLRPHIQRSPCIIPAACTASSKTVLCQLRFGATVQPFDFPEISLFPLRASASRAAFQGHRPPAAHALRARNSLKYIAQTTSVQGLPAL